MCLHLRSTFPHPQFNPQHAMIWFLLLWYNWSIPRVPRFQHQRLQLELPALLTRPEAQATDPATSPSSPSVGSSKGKEWRTLKKREGVTGKTISDHSLSYVPATRQQLVPEYYFTYFSLQPCGWHGKMRSDILCPRSHVTADSKSCCLIPKLCSRSELGKPTPGTKPLPTHLCVIYGCFWATGRAE